MVAVAQLVEHRIVIPVVAGSSPVGHPILLFYFSSPRLFSALTLLSVDGAASDRASSAFRLGVRFATDLRSSHVRFACSASKRATGAFCCGHNRRSAQLSFWICSREFIKLGKGSGIYRSAFLPAMRTRAKRCRERLEVL